MMRNAIPNMVRKSRNMTQSSRKVQILRHISTILHRSWFQFFDLLSVKLVNIIVSFVYSSSNSQAMSEKMNHDECSNIVIILIKAHVSAQFIKQDSSRNKDNIRRQQHQHQQQQQQYHLQSRCHPRI